MYTVFSCYTLSPIFRPSNPTVCRDVFIFKTIYYGIAQFLPDFIVCVACPSLSVGLSVGHKYLQVIGLKYQNNHLNFMLNVLKSPAQLYSLCIVPIPLRGSLRQSQISPSFLNNQLNFMLNTLKSPAQLYSLCIVHIPLRGSLRRSQISASSSLKIPK
jgi:hypothetical protein